MISRKCCIGEVASLDPKVKDYIHPSVREKGISPSEWKQWMEGVDGIQKKAPSVTGCLLLFLFPGGLFSSSFLYNVLPDSKGTLSWLPCFHGYWYAALKKWQEIVNARLSLYGMYAKLVTYKPVGSASRSRRYEERIVAKDHSYEM